MGGRHAEQFSWFLNYDPFGRPAVIQPADGNTHDVTLTYHGVRQVDRTVKVATAASTETSATTIEVSDAHGRLFSITEPSGSSGANVTTFYGYDVGSRLASVSTTAAGITQNRGFTYDRAGLLQSETHPEKGVFGNGSVTYPKYDARGHALQKIDGPHDLTFQYDTAERLGQVLETGGRPLKSFSYSPANGTNDWSLGKLQKASRFNYVTLSGTAFTAQIDETYTYGGRDGRVSKRDTRSSTGEAFTQSFTYNDLGLVSQLNYPLCTHAGCTSPTVFADVHQDDPFQREIEAIYPGVTSGCSTTSPPYYCPGNSITRGEIAVFLLRAKEGPSYLPPACTTAIFNDVPCSNPFAPWIQEIYHRGITGGCSQIPFNYCPGATITNAQMAVFLVVALGVPSPACTAAPFTDVLCSSFAAGFIAED
jgi:YD repeat-containing protein